MTPKKYTKTEGSRPFFNTNIALFIDPHLTPYFPSAIFLLAFLIMFAVFSTNFFASPQSPTSTASRIAGKNASSYPDQSCGPKITCLNCVLLGIYFEMLVYEIDEKREL